MTLEKTAEKVLWGSRFIVIVAVVASIFVCFGMYTVATIDVVHLIRNVYSYLISKGKLDEESQIFMINEELRNVIVAGIVGIIDGYLLATTMLIFAFGLYELFISKIDVAKFDKLSSRVLSIKSIDDLKERLSKLILLILIVNFFEQSLSKNYDGLKLLYYALGIFLIGAALYLSHKKGGDHGNDGVSEEEDHTNEVNFEVKPVNTEADKKM